MGAKKKPETQRDNRDGIEILGVTKATDLTPKAQTKKSKYDEIVEKALLLRPGEVLEISAYGEDDIATARNKISAVVRRLAQPYSPYHLKIRITERDTVGIYCSQPRKKGLRD